MGSVSCDTTKQFTAVFMKLFIPKPHPGGGSLECIRQPGAQLWPSQPRHALEKAPLCDTSASVAASSECPAQG